MKPIDFEGATTLFKKPANWDDATMGECATLPVQANEYGLHSVWQPTDEERMAIAAGGSVRLTVVGGTHPPVALDVIPTDAPSLAAEIDPILDYAADAMWEVFRKSPVAAPVYADMSWSDLLAIAASNADDPDSVVHQMVRVGRDEMRAVIKRIWPLAGFLGRYATTNKDKAA